MPQSCAKKEDVKLRKVVERALSVALGVPRQCERAELGPSASCGLGRCPWCCLCCRRASTSSENNLRNCTTSNPATDRWETKPKDHGAMIKELVQQRANVGAALSAPNPEEKRPEPWELCLRDHCGSVIDRSHKTVLIWSSSKCHRDLLELLGKLDSASIESSLHRQRKPGGESESSESTDGSVVLLVEDLLPYLIRGEGDMFTEMVKDLLEEAFNASYVDARRT